MNKPTYIWLCFLAACLSIAGYIKYSQPSDFVSVKDAEKRLSGAFYCTYVTGVTNDTFVVSTIPLTTEEATEFQATRMAGSNRMALVVNKQAAGASFGDWRIWGEVAAVGDPRLLDTIEALR